MIDPEVVTLSRFPEIFAGFRESVDQDAPDLRKLVVWDTATLASALPEMVEPWHWVFSMRRFKMAEAANLGLAQTSRKADVLYAGDDTRIIEPDTIRRLQALAYSNPTIGILSPRILGHAQACQTHPGVSPLQFTEFAAFVFVYIKREVLNAVGNFDIRFDGYGWDDVDFCYRARLAGYSIAVASDIKVKHGFQHHVYGSTFIRVNGEEKMGKETNVNMARFAEKWGIENEPRAIWSAVQNLSATKQG